MENEQKIIFNPEYSVLARATLPDGRVIDMTPLLFGQARLNVVNKHFHGIYDTSY